MSEWIDLAEYDSIRVNGSTHGGRWGGAPGVVQPSGHQKLTLGYRGPYIAFRITPEGVEFPISMVSSAVPKQAALASKTKRTKDPSAPEEKVLYGRQKKLAPTGTE